MKIIDPFKLINDKIKKLDKGDILSLVTVFIVGIINNFYFIISRGVAPDAVSSAHFQVAGNWEITLGRFLIKYVNLMRYGYVNQLIIILISLACIAISVLILKRIFKIKSKVVIFILSCLICVAPQFTETYMFIYCADAYLIAFLLAILSVYFLGKTENKKINYIFSIICVALLCALYQAYLGVAIGLTIMLLFYRLIIEDIKIKELIKKFIIYMLVMFAGVVCYYLILKIILAVLSLTLSSYKGANSLGIKTITMLPKTIVQCYKDFYSFFFTNNIIGNGWWHRSRLYAIIFVATSICLFKYVFSKKNKFTVFALLLVLGLIYPITINVMNLIAVGTRINLVTGPGLLVTVLFPIIILDNSKNDSLSNLSKWIILIFSIILIWTFVLENTFTYVAREQTYINYETVATDIYTKVTSLDNYSTDKEWMFSDIIRFRVRDLERSNGFITHDNLTWDNYQGILQNKSAFEKVAGVKINVVNKEKYDKIKKTSEFIEMPVYPNIGSIKIIDDVIVIKTSERVY